MDRENASALEASIKHWEENRAVDIPQQARVSSDDCALCDLHILSDCKDCPVAKRTGRKGCNGSPYFDVYLRLREWAEWPDDPNRREAWQKACDEEIAFLKSLREDTR